MKTTEKPKLYAITTDALLDLDNSLDLIECGLRSGIELLQYRRKKADAARQTLEARALKQLTDRYHVPLIINDDATLAHEIGANGVHIGQSDGDQIKARELLGEDAMIGVTCHNQIMLAKKAIEDGANYVSFGRFFPSNTKPNAKPADTNVLEAAKKLQKPICVIGGITLKNISILLSYAPDLVAAADAVWGDMTREMIEKNVYNWRQILSTHSQYDS